MILSKRDAFDIIKIINDNNITSVIFDLDGIFIETDKKQIEASLGFLEKAYMAKHTIRYLSKPNKEWIFHILDLITEGNIPKMNEAHQVYNDGLKMPQIMCEWQAGFRDSVDSQKLTNDLIKKALGKELITKNNAHVLTLITDLTYNVKRFVSSRKMTEGGVELVKLLRLLKYHDEHLDEYLIQDLNKEDKQHLNEHLQVFLLTNFADDQFVECKKKFPDLFELFQDAIVSGNVKLVKPDPSIFRMAIGKGCDPSKTLFVDDELKNIDGAFKVGIRYAFAPGKGVLINHNL